MKINTIKSLNYKVQMHNVQNDHLAINHKNSKLELVEF